MEYHEPPHCFDTLACFVTMCTNLVNPHFLAVWFPSSYVYCYSCPLMLSCSHSVSYTWVILFILWVLAWYWVLIQKKHLMNGYTHDVPCESSFAVFLAAVHGPPHNAVRYYPYIQGQSGWISSTWSSCRCLFIAGKLDQMTFKGPFQLKWFSDSPWPNTATPSWICEPSFPLAGDWSLLLIFPAHLVALGFNCQLLLLLSVGTLKSQAAFQKALFWTSTISWFGNFCLA